MATNQVLRPGYRQALVVTDPAAPASGDAVRIGALTGVAMEDEGAGGAGATETVVDIGPGRYRLTVDDNGAVTPGTGSTITLGQKLYYHDTATGSPATHINNTPTSADAFFGYALETATANATVTIEVQHELG